MIILRQKIYFEKQEYYKLGQRIKMALGAAISGGLVGATMLAFPGLILGGLRGARTGAILGAGLGSVGMGAAGWSGTSKASVDRENKRRKKQEEFMKKAEEDPSILFEDLKNDTEIIRQFRVLEAKYNVKFPDQFYKLIKIRKDFIPTLVNWYKKYKDMNYTSVLYSIVPSVTEASLNDNDEILFLLIDPEMADDTWITYDSTNGKFGYDIFSDKNDYNTLKDAILHKLDFLEDYSDDSKSTKELIRLYRQYINSKL